MFWPPNIDGIRWFIDEVYPLIREKRPEIVFDVIGARPPQDLVDLNQKGIGVNVTGYVEDPNPYLEQAGVMVVPVRAGGGMRVKILNALAQRLPIVSTTIGSEGIAVESGRHLLIADTPQNFAQATLRLLNDPDLANALGRNGRQLVQEVYDYRAACAPLDAIYSSMINKMPVQKQEAAL
jgi:glycosyltransferase involved in cell wall biosynthesis